MRDEGRQPQPKSNEDESEDAQLNFNDKKFLNFFCFFLKIPEEEDFADGAKEMKV